MAPYTKMLMENVKVSGSMSISGNALRAQTKPVILSWKICTTLQASFPLFYILKILNGWWKTEIINRNLPSLALARMKKHLLSFLNDPPLHSCIWDISDNNNKRLLDKSAVHEAAKPKALAFIKINQLSTYFYLQVYKRIVKWNVFLISIDSLLNSNKPWGNNECK